MPANKQNSRTLAVNYLLKQIKCGAMRPGDKLTNERELSEQLGISRVPLREAICTLSTIGLLEAKQGNGTFVKGHDPSLLGKIIQTYGLFERSLVEEVFEARLLLEADAAELAASNRTAADLQRLEAALTAHEEALPLYYKNALDTQTMLARDGEVHLGFAACSHNNFLVQIIESLRYATLSADLFNDRYTVNKQHFQESAAVHKAIYKAIAAQNPVQARSLMQNHIQNIRKALDIPKLLQEENF